jgi:hypothetical protein
VKSCQTPAIKHHSEIGAIMTGPGPDIDTALSGDGPIASEQVLSWIDAAADSDQFYPISIDLLARAITESNRN